MLPWLRDRPLTLVRAPDGVEGSGTSRRPHRPTPRRGSGRSGSRRPSAKRDVDYVVCDDAATLAWLGNQAALEFHPAPVRADRLDRPDLLVVDIDPPEGAFDAAVEAALLVCEVLDDLGVAFGVKTTGGQGPPRRGADRAPRGPGRASPRRRAADCPRGLAPAGPDHRRVPQGGAGRPRDAGSVAQRHGRDPGRPLLPARPAGRRGLLPARAGRAGLRLAPRLHGRERAGAARPAGAPALAGARGRAAPACRRRSCARSGRPRGARRCRRTRAGRVRLWAAPSPGAAGSAPR